MRHAEGVVFTVGGFGMMFANRAEAGRALADEVARRVPSSGSQPLVLALPRGGVPVAVPVAQRLGAELDIVLTRGIAMPGRPEFGVGAIAEDGPAVFDEMTLHYLHLTPDDLAGAVEAGRVELAGRRDAYRAARPAPSVAGRPVILVGDGLATGVTARAALQWLVPSRPHALAVAAPVCSREARDAVGAAATLVCLHLPDDFAAVGRWYDDFPALTDADVTAALPAHA